MNKESTFMLKELAKLFWIVAHKYKDLMDLFRILMLKKELKLRRQYQQWLIKL
jgi:hypothetical protein